MGRTLSRIALGDAGTTIGTSASTFTGDYDGVSALSTGTIGLTISNATYTGLAIAAGSTVTGDITQVIISSGGPFAIYKRTV
jgi:hypothetical protein